MSKIKAQPPCPECEKLAAVSDESNKIGAFLEWLSNNSYVLSEWNDKKEQWDVAYYLHDTNINYLLACYYGIDLDKVEKERKALLEWLREQYDQEN